MSEKDKLSVIRDEIDEIDQQIQLLISRRAECAQKVAEIKIASGNLDDFYRPEREAQVLAKIKKRNQGPLSEDEMARLFREIMSTCLALESPLQVVYLGPVGTYSQDASNKHFGGAAQLHPQSSIDEVFREVEVGNAHYGVVPVENSTEGSVNLTLDLLAESPVRICGEVSLDIHHHLLSRDVDRKTITKLYGHQQSLAQCRKWLDNHMPAVERVAVSSNAEAAMCAAKEKHTAAIASKTAADIYALTCVDTMIEDESDNVTRFLVIGRQKVLASGNDKTSLLISTHNRSGALQHMLDPFAKNNISLSRIESRPSRRTNWDYMFFVDVSGHVDDKDLCKAMTELEEKTVSIKVLGSYPKAVI